MDRKLPDWLKESREAEKLIAWLKSPDCEVKEFSGQLFIKARYGNCFFFFDCLKENRKTDRNWCAVIHMPEYSLYEAEDLFLKPIGIPDDFGFPVREDLIPKLETQMHYWYAKGEETERKLDIRYIERKFPQTVFEILPELGHGGLALLKPELFAEMICKLS